jgi:hypothetical protein
MHENIINNSGKTLCKMDVSDRLFIAAQLIGPENNVVGEWPVGAGVEANEECRVAHTGLENPENLVVGVWPTWVNLCSCTSSLVASIMVGMWPTRCIIAVSPDTGLSGPEDVGDAVAVPTCTGLSGPEDVGAAIAVPTCTGLTSIAWDVVAGVWLSHTRVFIASQS